MFRRAKLGDVLPPHEIKQLRRSAAMAPLSESAVLELIDTVERLVSERERIEGVLAALPESFAEVRNALNELSRIVTRDGP